MYIDFDRLRDRGFKVELTKKGVHIHPEYANQEATELAHKLADALFLSPRDHDDLICKIDEIIVVSALRS